MPTRNRLLACAVAAVALCSGVPAEARAAGAERQAPIMEKIRTFRAVTWRWERLMRVPRTPATRAAERSSSVALRRWVLSYWRKRAATVRRKAQNPPRLRAWRCIQRHEGAWNANTGNGYYGGLQMDLAFQRRYGLDLLRKKGTANRWRPIEQVWVAERAYRSGRGFWPWPNTARACGLL
jgi:hypothetical protein